MSRQPNRFQVSPKKLVRVLIWGTAIVLGMALWISYLLWHYGRDGAGELRETIRELEQQK